MSAAIPTNGVTRDIDVENERTPLLRRQDGQVETLPEIVDDLKKSGKTTPLPKIQLTLICLIRLTEPVAFTVIFPYVNQMLLDVGAADTEEGVGYAAGVVEALFSITQLLTVFYWGRLSDKIGRKPVLIMGSFGSAITGMLYGSSTTYRQVIIYRCLAGAANGNVSVLKSIMGEISDSTNQARAFSFFPLMLNVGSMIAASIGGNFARPAINHPRIVQLFPIFETYPYLLPSIMAGFLPIAAGTLAIFFLKETLPPKRSPTSSVIRDPVSRDESVDENGSDATVVHSPAEDPASDFTYSSLFTWKIMSIMFSFGMISLVGTALAGLSPLYYFTSIRAGGVGFSAKEIGYAMTIRSVTTILIQLLVFPPLQRRVNTTRLYKILLFFYLPLVWGLPVINLVAKSGNNAAVWVSIMVLSLCGSIANMANVCNLIMVNDASPSPYALGAINGVSQSVACAVRIFGPGGATILFALSVGKHILGGWLIWIVMGILALITAISGLLIPPT